MSTPHLNLNYPAQAQSMKFFGKYSSPSWANLSLQLFRNDAESKGEMVVIFHLSQKTFSVFPPSFVPVKGVLLLA